jgi:hypothetical protein
MSLARVFIVVVLCFAAFTTFVFAEVNVTYCRYQNSNTEIVLGNNIVELNIKKATGYFNKISNMVHNRDYKAQNAGSWPFGMEVTTPGGGSALSVAISASGVQQQMTEQIETIANGKLLRMSYANMLTTGGAATGVALTVEITLENGSDYFLVKADIQNNGSYDLTNFYSGNGALIAANTRQAETLIVPGWDYGKVYDNPYNFFTQRKTYGYPIFGSQCALTAGWIDLLGTQGGIGMGYLNRQGMTMLFNVQRQGTGVNVNWQLFNLNDPGNTWTTERGVYPLRPGESFTTDQWIIAPHGGDWHRMADIYRQEYEKAFSGTFLNEDNNNPIVEKIDMGAAYIIENIQNNPPIPARNFNEVPPYVAGLVQTYETGYDNIIFVLIGCNEDWPSHFPDFLPANSDAGGDAGLQQALTDLRNVGMESVVLYGHPYYNHPEANDYVPEAETGVGSVYFSHLGNLACTEVQEWQDLWHDNYAPGFRNLGAAGVYWDQGPTQYSICPNNSHPVHGDDCVKKLTTHTKGVLQIQDSFDQQYAVDNRDALMWTEVSSDLTGRTMDVWTTTLGDYSSGGIQKKEIVRYAIPYHYCIDTTPFSVEELNYSWANGFILAPNLSQDIAETRICISARKQLRTNGFGFPCGFKDTVGLMVGSADLVARAYRSDEGISVLYFAKQALTSSINVSSEALGFEGGRDFELPITLAKDEIGYELIPLEQIMANQVLPDFVGMTQANAEAAIVAAGFTVGAITTAYSETVAIDIVISQNPTEGTLVTAGTPVDIVVSLGNVRATVPDVVGQNQTTAQADIVSANLVVGAITTAYSDTFAAGVVISQNPTDGTDVLAGSPVDIVVSLGVSPGITNHSFEHPVLADGSFNGTTPPDGWVVDAAGWYTINPNAQQMPTYGPPPDGDQVLYVYRGTVRQDNVETIADNTVYTFKLDYYSLVPADGMEMKLFAYDTDTSPRVLVASADPVLTGAWQTVSVSFDSTGSDYVGQKLSVGFYSGYGSADNASLTVTAVGDVNNDGTVDLLDLQQIATYWLEPGARAEDIDGNLIVDLADLSLLAADWLQD